MTSPPGERTQNRPDGRSENGPRDRGIHGRRDGVEDASEAASGLDVGALDWGAVVEALASRARTPMGAQAARALAPLPSREAVEAVYDSIDELGILAGRRTGPLPLGRIEDISLDLARAGRGQTLGYEELSFVAGTVAALEELRAILASHAEATTSLAGFVPALTLEPRLIATLDRALDAQGNLSESAYPMLGELRGRIAGFERRIRSELGDLLASGEMGEVLQDSFVTIRNDRFVVPVVAKAKNLGLGIVHDASRTGRTVYVEPARIVPLGNERRLAEAALAAEQERILRELSELIGASRSDLETATEAAVTLDLLQARREFAVRLRGVRPVVGNEGLIHLTGARHPVLQLQSEAVVANDLHLDSATPILVLTGPNAGGKTVALKTLGLAAALVRIGCFVPAEEGSRVDFFDEIRADIGDHQSVRGGLSSFSGHLVTLRGMLDAARPGTLLLLDEVASGTDPTQGGPLARALIERFADLGARVVVTTHYAQVKAMAAADSRVAVAALEYIDEKPTYRVVAGMAGESHALSAAQAVGLDAGLVERARELMDEGERALADALAELERAHEESALLERKLEDDLRQVALRERKVAAKEADIARGRKQLEREAAAELVDRVRRAEKEIGRVVAQLQRAPNQRDAAAARETVLGLGAEIRDAVAPSAQGGPDSGLRSNARPTDDISTSSTREFKVGDRVRVTALGSTGEVTLVRKNRLEVRVGVMSMRLRTHEVEKLPAEMGSGPIKPKSDLTPFSKSDSRAEMGPEFAFRTPANTLDLRGQRVADGLRQLEEFLDAAVLSADDAVFILHGHGTGVMKSAVRDALANSPYVASYQAAATSQGGDGLTVVVLRA